MNELCSWEKHFILTVPLTTQFYKWVQANWWGGGGERQGRTCDGLASHPGEVAILLVVSCYKKGKTLQLSG